jgi:hypothetical protein
VLVRTVLTIAAPIAQQHHFQTAKVIRIGALGRAFEPLRFSALHHPLFFCGSDYRSGCLHGRAMHGGAGQAKGHPKRHAIEPHACQVLSSNKHVSPTHPRVSTHLLLDHTHAGFKPARDASSSASFQAHTSVQTLAEPSSSPSGHGDRIHGAGQAPYTKSRILIFSVRAVFCVITHVQDWDALLHLPCAQESFLITTATAAAVPVKVKI